MDQFRTTFPIPEAQKKIYFSDQSFFMGSCFAQNIGSRVAELKFKTELNPFGILYNPASILSGLERILNKSEMEALELIYHDDQWLSLNHHGHFSNPDKSDCINNINQRIQSSHQSLLKSKYLFISFGTAWIYEWKETGTVVANCHKFPSSKFHRRLLKPSEIIDSYSVFLETLIAKIPGIKVVFTLSPIRHWKDGAIENQRSKSILHSAIHEIIERTTDTGYFPAYELVMDDLRDYRFYSEDMFHINPTGLDYIWQRFEECYIDSKAKKLIPDIEKILRSYHHRISGRKSISQSSFAKSNLEQIETLTKAYSYLDFSGEIKHFQKLL